jgi:ribosomal protein S18 acetylase RimI-like enzyme
MGHKILQNYNLERDVLFPSDGSWGSDIEEMPTVRFATSEDLSWIESLANAHRRELGFVGRVVLAAAIAKSEILCISGCGFLHFHHRRDRISTLYHLCVNPSQRRSGIGRQLIAKWSENSRQNGIKTLRLKCPIDSIANGFYQRLNFQRQAIENGKQRSLVVWEKKLPNKPPKVPDFIASFSASGSELNRLFKLWKEGKDPQNRNPFAKVIYSPLVCPKSTTTFLRKEKDKGGIETVWFDCGAYQVQQGKRTYEELLSFLGKFYSENLWADGYVLPDLVPLTTDDDETVEYKVRDTLNYCQKLFEQMPPYARERAIAPVQGRNIDQINRCIETYAKLGIKRIGFGSWGTSGPNGSVNMLAKSSLALFNTVCNIAREDDIKVHCFGIGGPNSLKRLRNNNLIPDSLDSTTWWKAGGYGSIFFPNTSQIQVTVRRGFETTKVGLEKLKKSTNHSCYFCENIEMLRTSRNHRIMHNLASWLDTLES